MEPITRFRDPYAFLSNFYPAPIWVDSVWPTLEHWYQAQKTHNKEERERIRAASSPGIAKRLGREVKLRKDWEMPHPLSTPPGQPLLITKDWVMLTGLRMKFHQHEDLQELLLATGDAHLEEHISGYWKIRLGELLMQVRDEITDEILRRIL